MTNIQGKVRAAQGKPTTQLTTEYEISQAIARLHERAELALLQGDFQLWIACHQQAHHLWAVRTNAL